jgi:hypothetical protein
MMEAKMATQKYMNRDTSSAPSVGDPTKTKGQRSVEMGFNGGNPTAGPVKTPAPLRAPPPTPDIARSTSFGRGNYGANAYGGASSIEPGTTVKQNGINIDPPGGDPALALVQKHGTVLGGKDPSEAWETRDVAKDEPAHPAMRERGLSDGSPGGVVPGTTVARSPMDDSDARRNARLKG